MQYAIAGAAAAHAAQHGFVNFTKGVCRIPYPLVHMLWSLILGLSGLTVLTLHGVTSNDQRSFAGTGEIGVPPYFAMRLSFPERVTPHNVEQLRQVRLCRVTHEPQPEIQHLF